MADPMTPERLAEIREREQAATPGPWEPGACWLTAGLIWDDDGKRVPPDEGTRCGFCHVGDPVWSGQTHINGTLMNAHRHRNPEPWDVENLISAANGDLVAGNFDYEQGGIIAPADTVFVAAAREDVPALLAEVERLRAELAETTHVLAVTGEKLEAIRGQRDKAEAERNAARAAQERLIAEVADERRRRAEHVRQVEAERDEAREQVKRVRALHVPHDCGDLDCPQIIDPGDCDMCGEPLPCPTVRALDGTEPGQ